MRLIILTAFALTAFAANSLLARAALGHGEAGAAEFTLLRLLSGAAVLIILLSLKTRNIASAGNWCGAAMLLIYAAAFSFAYLRLDTGTGALALFTSVQLTMLGWAGFKTGLSKGELCGSALAFAGFIYLMLPALNIETIGAASLGGFGLMAISGIGWGVYTILGHGSRDPLAQTTGNFWRAGLLALPLAVFIFPDPAISPRGAILAVTSGALTSAIGYAIWYAALPKLPSSLAAALQLLVPPGAALMGWGFLGETLSWRLAIALFMISSGIGLVIKSRQGRSP